MDIGAAALAVLEQQGAEALFGEPALQLSDIMRTDGSGRGVVNVLAADKLIASPRLYATFLLVQTVRHRVVPRA